MMGDYETGQRLARDGKILIEDVNAFGQEWQVTKEEPMIFMIPRAPFAGEDCKMHAVDKANKCCRLGETVAQSVAEAACAHAGDSIEQCVYDVMATGDLELAQGGVY